MPEESVTMTDDAGNTPLHYAAKYGNAQLCELLLEAKASISEYDPCFVCLLASCSYTHLIWAFLCIRRGTDGMTPLHVAAFHGHFRCVSVFSALEEAPEVMKLLDNNGRT